MGALPLGLSLRLAGSQREPRTERRIWTMRLSIELAIFACVFLLGWIFSHGLLHGLLDSTWTGYEILIGAALMVWLMMRYYRNRRRTQLDCARHDERPNFYSAPPDSHQQTNSRNNSQSLVPGKQLSSSELGISYDMIGLTKVSKSPIPNWSKERKLSSSRTLPVPKLSLGCASRAGGDSLGKLVC